MRGSFFSARYTSDPETFGNIIQQDQVGQPFLGQFKDSWSSSASINIHTRERMITL